MSRHWPCIVIAVLLTAFAIRGCATGSRKVWTKTSAGRDDLARDRYACIQESRVPWGQAIGSLGSASSTFGFVGSMAQGGTRGGFIFLGVHRRAQTEANRLFDACMEARGWQ